jgi:hypothetical protein
MCEMSNLEAYREQAAKCMRAANEVRGSGQRAELLGLASVYTALADYVDRHSSNVIDAIKTRSERMTEFTLLFRGSGRDQASASPDQLQKWGAWMKDIGDKGHLKDAGHPLEYTGKVVSGKQKTVHDGPYAEAKNMLGGYAVVEARDVAHAVEISKGCPILEAGGSVEVRPVAKPSM